MGFKLIGFRKSTRSNKKYDAILGDEKGNTIYIPFGDTRYGQYKDTTGLGLYSKGDHLDEKRRASYRARHGGASHQSHLVKNSPAYFSWTYLW